jgi:hypothetical protein
MPIKITRDIALIRFRKLPLREYDNKNETDIFHYPEFISFYWIKLEKPTNKKLTMEFKKLIKLLSIEKLVVLGQVNKPWISEHIRGRQDFKTLTKTIEYFKLIKIKKKFNGALEVSREEIDIFIPNFYTLTICDSSFSDYYITDKGENILFHIHYSGEIKILTLTKEIQEKLSSIVSKTKFVDALRDATDRI